MKFEHPIEGPYCKDRAHSYDAGLTCDSWHLVTLVGTAKSRQSHHARSSRHVRSQCINPNVSLKILTSSCFSENLPCVINRLNRYLARHRRERAYSMPKSDTSWRSNSLISFKLGPTRAFRALAIGQQDLKRNREGVYFSRWTTQYSVTILWFQHSIILQHLMYKNVYYL